jgi:hypothetical protein
MSHSLAGRLAHRGPREPRAQAVQVVHPALGSPWGETYALLATSLRMLQAGVVFGMFVWLSALRTFCPPFVFIPRRVTRR